MQDSYRGKLQCHPKKASRTNNRQENQQVWRITESVFLTTKKASGKIWMEVKHKGECHQEDFFVVEGNELTMISGDLCKNLGLVQRIGKVEHSEFYDVAKPYVDVFKCFGKLERYISHHTKGRNRWKRQTGEGSARFIARQDKTRAQQDRKRRNYLQSNRIDTFFKLHGSGNEERKSAHLSRYSGPEQGNFERALPSANTGRYCTTLARYEVVHNT